MKTRQYLAALALTLACGVYADEVYKCPGENGRPLFTSTRGPGCELQTLKVIVPSEKDVEMAKARNERKAMQDKQDAEAKKKLKDKEDEKRRQMQTRQNEVEAAQREKAAREQIRLQREWNRALQEGAQLPIVPPWAPLPPE